MNYELDIKNWTDCQTKQFEYSFPNKRKEAKFNQRISPLNIDPKPLYALLTKFISKKPNGYYTYMQKGLPLDNMIWWDFILTCGDSVIHVWKTCLMLEAGFYSDSKTINIEKYSKDINETLNSLEKHSVYLNHYKSYSQCVNFLWKEITQINLTPPKIPETHVVTPEMADNIGKTSSEYLKNSVKFHVLGKSLILNSAFMAEAFINTLIRIGLDPQFYEFDSVFKNFMKSNFSDRLKGLPLFSRIFADKVNFEEKVIKDTVELMTLRNKYVHADESSHYNKIGQIFFDNDFPVFGSDDVPWGFEEIRREFHNPSFELVKWSYDVTRDFIKYIEGLINEKIREQIVYLANQNPIGFNENKQVYSAIFREDMFNFYLVGNSENKNNS